MRSEENCLRVFIESACKCSGGEGISEGSDNALQTLRWEEKILLSSHFRAETLWVAVQ